MAITVPGLATASARCADMKVGQFIGGSFVQSGGNRWAVINPATGATIRKVPLADATHVDDAVAAATAALPGWRNRPPSERAAVLMQVADIVDHNAELFARIESINGGKPIDVARAELPSASDTFRFMAGAARTAHTPAADTYVSGQLSMIRREPVGVVGAITPWNYPLQMAMWKVAPALAAGNTVVLKPSELTPLTTLLFAELTAEVIPSGVLNVVVGTGENVGQAIASHAGIAMVSLTGSVGSGKAIASSASSTLKRVHLELGGKAPVVVFDDADLDEVVDAIAVMGTWNCGQECAAATRVLCDETVARDLVDKLVPRFDALRVGDPNQDDDIDVGPLISAVHQRRVSDMVAQAARDGATIATGGRVINRGGFYYEPTVLTDLPLGVAATRDEIFGPVVTVETFTDEGDAVVKANNVVYGLAASVWTENGARAMRMSSALDFGTVWINSHLTMATEMPWGGFGASGYGRDLSTYGLDDYTRTKHIMVATREANQR